MDKGILSIKIMILGAVLFLCGCEFAFANSLPAVLAFMAGPVLMLIGLLVGNRREAKV
ncbi:MAG: hypothetical protein HFG09_05780 [Oscillibacter sp.]|nr:hypothetical protein [Oscillibacter sp.]